MLKLYDGGQAITRDERNNSIVTISDRSAYCNGNKFCSRTIWYVASRDLGLSADNRYVRAKPLSGVERVIAQRIAYLLLFSHFPYLYFSLLIQSYGVQKRSTCKFLAVVGQKVAVFHPTAVGKFQTKKM